MKCAIFLLGLTLYASCGHGAENAGNNLGLQSDKVISRTDPTNNLIIKNEKIQLIAERYFAGAFTSLVYKNKEYIKTANHRFGIELQSAATFDGLGECFNPTEAGGRYDNQRAEGSSSVLLESKVGERTIETKTQMAFWWPPNRKYFSPRGDSCGERKEIHFPAYQEKLSNFLLHKKITVETIRVQVDGHEVVVPWLNYEIVLTIPSTHTSGEIEAVTAYLPSDFSLHASFDPVVGKSKELLPDKARGMSMQTLPVILATQDKAHAMGVFAVPAPGQKVSYGSYKFPGDTNKWNCLFHEKKITSGDYHYRCLIPIGTMSEVEEAIKQLYVRYGAANIK